MLRYFTALLLTLILLLGVCAGAFFMFGGGIIADYYKEEGHILLTQEKDYDGAREKYEKALRFDERNADTRMSLAALYIFQQDYEQAEKVLREGIDTMPGHTDFYLTLLQMYTKKGDISAALDFRKSIKRDTVLRELAVSAPKNISYNPRQGQYDGEMTVTLASGINDKIYYTLDGSQPTLESMEYINPLIFKEKGHVTLRAFAINQQGLLSEELLVEYDIVNQNEPVVFKDAKIETMVKLALGKNQSAVVRTGELVEITELSNLTGDGFALPSKIETLDDLSIFSNLHSLYLEDETAIKDFSGIKNLQMLDSLTLTRCNLINEDVASFGGLLRLKELVLDSNSLTSLSFISGFPNLRKLSVNNNTIGSLLELSNMNTLNELQIANNALESLAGLENMNKLTLLSASGNRITDISALPDTAPMVELNLAENAVTDISRLAAYSGMRKADLQKNMLTTIDALSRLTSLEEVNADDNQISFIPNMIGPTRRLHLSGNQIVDLSPIGQMRYLSEVHIAHNQITDVTPMRTAPSLRLIDIEYNQVTGIMPLTTLPMLETLYCKGNPIEGLSEFQKEKPTVGIFFEY